MSNYSIEHVKIIKSTRNFKELYEYCLQHAGEDADALVELSLCYHQGRGISKDVELGHHYAELAAEKGVDRGKAIVAFDLVFGKEVNHHGKI